ncbi:uncharacterized protein ACIB01_017020 isoform 2-T2 [Guaruba guarouba]
MRKSQKELRSSQHVDNDHLTALDCHGPKLSLRLRRQSGLQFPSSAPSVEAGGASNAKPVIRRASDKTSVLLCGEQQNHRRTGSATLLLRHHFFLLRVPKHSTALLNSSVALLLQHPGLHSSRDCSMSQP